MQPVYSLHDNAKVFFKFLLYLLALLYLANCFTPLHLHVDSVRYFNIKDCMEGHCPDVPIGPAPSTDYLPYGYTALLIVLSKLGILKSFSIIFINCLYIFGGLYFVKKIFEGRVNPLLLAVVVLLNWTIFKFTAHPLSEMQYIFFSSASLYCFHLYVKKKNYLQLGLAFLFAILTVLTRAVGISLVAALFIGILWQYRNELTRIIKKNKFVLIVLALAFVVVIFFAKQLKLVDYTNLMKEPLQQGIGNFIITNLKNHFKEFAEVFLNVPVNKVESYSGSGLISPLFILLGFCFFVWLMFNLFSRRNQIPFYIKIYLVFYALIILNWPYGDDPRFWVPILPLMAAVILQTPFNSNSFGKLVSKLYFAAYMLLGFVAIAYALYIGFDKERFATNHARGDYRKEYEQHFFKKTYSDSASNRSDVLRILERYD